MTCLLSWFLFVFSVQVAAQTIEVNDTTFIRLDGEIKDTVKLKELTKKDGDIENIKTNNAILRKLNDEIKKIKP